MRDKNRSHMNEYDNKRLQRDIDSTEANLKRPVIQQILTNTLFWGLVLGPLTFFITKYEKGVSFPWEQLPKHLLIFAVVGGLLFTYVMIWFQKRQLKSLKKKLDHIEN